MVSCKNANPPAVGFHFRCNEQTKGLSDQRTVAAAKFYESYDAAPKILKEGKDYFIDEWNGKSIGPHPGNYDKKTVSIEEVASFLA